MSMMKQTNEYLKKGTLILAIIMLLAIPNLPVYSSIGSYQTSSSAITANKNYMPFTKNGVNRIADVFTGLSTDQLIGVYLALPVESSNPLEEAIERLMANEDGHHGHPLASRYATETYAKYDFSGFDN